ncbi:MAG: glycosyltransferase family 4 protein [Bacteroidales bacterium]|nr:glycosyltransferase family 4 protein [Bacteroidales bacterium]
MKIIHVIPGSGGSFYCGNCLRDSEYFNAMRKMGHDAIKIPMYLPLFADEHDLSGVPVFYGAISIYMKQMFPLLQKAPAWFDKLLNSKPMLKLAASMAGSTRAKGLDEMTISMLLGEQGRQHEELERMTDWMAEHFKPDVIHLSNALLLGLAHKMQEKLDVPLICSLQDEDTWVDVMNPASREKVWSLMGEKAKFVDRFVAVSRYYGDVSVKKMNLPPEKVTTLHIGVDPADYTFINSAEKSRNIGFLSRMSHENGLDILADAFVELKKDMKYQDVKLIVTGGSTGDDARFLRSVRNKFSSLYLANSVEFHKNFEGEGRKDFLRKVSILSVPVRQGEAFGIYLAEAMASGIPVVQPSLGAFPEIIEKTRGGLLYGENRPELLAEALKILLDDREKLRTMSMAARKGVEEGLNINTLAAELINIYNQAIEEQHVVNA